MKARTVVDGQDARVDTLLKTYEKYETHAEGLRDDEPERKENDPLGLKERGGPPALNDFVPAHDAVERTVAFFALMIDRFQLRPEHVVYATELFALNVLNGEGNPLNPSVADAMRARAASHYTTVRREMAKRRSP